MRLKTLRVLPVVLAVSASATALVDSQVAKGDVAALRSPTLTPQQSGTVNRLQAVSPVNSRVVWASGVGGTYVVTTDGGATWRAGVVAGAAQLQFRDVQGVSATVAYLLSAGVGPASRIYKTEDGGASWSLQFQNLDPDAFYDCFAFWTARRGIAMSDAVNGRLPVIQTTDGATWTDIGHRLPAAQVGEAAFAASGTCVATQGRSRAWIGTGGAAKARILATTDVGHTWTAYDTPIVQGTASSGVFSVDFRDALHGILGAGELAAPTAFADTVARSSLPMAAILPLRIPPSPEYQGEPVPSMIRPWAITRSNRAFAAWAASGAIAGKKSARQRATRLAEATSCLLAVPGPHRIDSRTLSMSHLGSIGTDPNRYSKLIFTILPCVPTNQPACGLANATAQ